MRVVSIPHSGTRSILSALKCGYDHVFVRENPYWGGFQDDLLICPLRDPLDVWRSWIKRVNKGAGAVPLCLFELQYHHLEALDKEYSLFYLPIDRTNFDLLDDLSERVGFLVRPGKIGSMDASVETDHLEPDWDYIYNLPFIKRFYEQIRGIGCSTSSTRNTGKPQQVTKTGVDCS